MPIMYTFAIPHTLKSSQKYILTGFKIISRMFQ